MLHPSHLTFLDAVLFAPALCGTIVASLAVLAGHLRQRQPLELPRTLGRGVDHIHADGILNINPVGVAGNDDELRLAA